MPEDPVVPDDTESVFDPDLFARDVAQVAGLPLEERVAALEEAEKRLRAALEDSSSRP